MARRFTHIRARAGRRVALLVGLVLSGYFAYHLALGARGVVRLSALEAEVARAESDLAAARAERDVWEARAAPLRGPAPDMDAVEARARDILGWRREGERTIVLQQ